MDGGFELREDVVAHLVTAGAELLRVGDFERRVESAPEDHAGDEPREHQETKAEHRTRPPQHAPKLERELPEPFQTGGRPRCIDRGHRRGPPGLARLSSVSMSVKSFSTGAFTSCCGTWHCVQKKRRGDTEARNSPSRSIKCVIESIGAWLSPVRARAWQERHLLPLR